MTEVTSELAAYVASVRDRELPPRVVSATRNHVLDTLAAVIAGSTLPAGRAGITYARDQGAPGGSVIIGQRLRRAPQFAALANAMCAHADESDDTHELSKSHPGCSIVPTALAVAELNGSSGPEFLRAVAAGYDVGPRVNMACWPRFRDVRSQPRGTPGISGMFGSAMAAAVLGRLDTRQVTMLLSYVAQQVAGMNTWKRDQEHVEKAYVLAGFPAFGSLLALSLVEAGWTGVEAVFDGDPNFLEIVGTDPRPEGLVEELGERFEVERTHIKRHAVGSPVQAPVQALLAIMEAHELTDEQVRVVRVTLPSLLAHTVQESRTMPNINLPYLLSTVLVEGQFSFEAAHDEDRFHAWRVAGGDERIHIVPDRGMEPRRQAFVELTTTTGQRLEHRVTVVRGSPENPMTDAEVRAKAMGLIAPVLGRAQAEVVADAVARLEESDDLGDLVTALDRAHAAGPATPDRP